MIDAPRRILVPIDLSIRSLLGLEYAAMLAASVGADLVLFCNVNLPERAALEELAGVEHLDLNEAGQRQLAHFAELRAPGIAATVAIGHDASPAHGILNAAHEHAADLIVVASHGRSGMTRWLLGSVAEKIVRTAQVPVVIVPTRKVPK